jgi:ADP-dependent NAD(P)H-hydrate dehydratase / NAD(P)H-hydrate epimerase
MAELVPLLSCAEAAELEARLLPDAAAAAVAMERAGLALAEAVERDFAWWREWPTVPEVLVLAGKGHNAGDALLATMALAQSAPNLRATVLWVFGEEGLKPNLVAARARLRDALGENLRELAWSEDTPAALDGETFDLTLDGMVGMQFRPPWREPGPEVVRWTHENAPRLGFRVAVDLPSGLGDAPGEVVFAADVTYATGIVKAPVLAEGATPWTGRVRFLDLGFFPTKGAGEAPPVEAVGTPGLLRAIGRLRPAASDKRVYGQVFVLGGSQRFPGAVMMASLAAVRGGAGLVTALVPSPVAPFLASAAVEAMWQPLTASVEGSLGREAMRQITSILGERGVLLIGPGLLADRNNTFIVCRLIREVALPLVLDAGALGADMVNALPGRPPNAGPVILTPHFGEYARMLNRPVERFDGEEFRQFCRKYRVTTILKGPVSRLSDGERLIHLPVGNPTLARGGSGDILAGLVATRLAAHPDDPLRAAMEATAWHGAAADALAVARGETGVRTTELLDFLAPVLRAAW